MNSHTPYIQQPESTSLPSEWTCHGAVLLAWPHENTDWNYMLEEAQQCFAKIAEAISAYQRLIIVSPDIPSVRKQLSHLNSEKITFVSCPTNDTWSRDFGPISVIDSNGHSQVCDFTFNGWGLKFASDLDNQVTLHLSKNGYITSDYINCRNFVLEGGGIESDGNGSLMTTARCQMSPNRNAWLNEDEIKIYLQKRFNARQILWLNHGALTGDDTDSHIDTLARFAPGNTIVYVGCDNPDDEHYAELNAMEAELKQMRTIDGNPYNLIALPLPDPIFDEHDNRLPATYANFLALPEAVIMPSYGQPMKDKLASMILEMAFERPVVSVDCNALIRQHGSLHCVTMQIPHQNLPECEK